MSEKLSAEERAYFESGGETEIPVAESLITGPPENQVSVGALELADDNDPDAVDILADDPPEQPSPEDKRQKQVPHAALHAERERRKQIEADLQKAREEAASFRGKLELLAEAMRKPSEIDQASLSPPPEIPDPDKDIFAFAKWQKEQMEKLQSQLEERSKAEQEAAQTQQAERMVWSKWEQDTVSYAAEKTDFPDASKYLAEVYDRILEADARFDPRLKDKAYRDQLANQQLKQIVAQAAQVGINSAEVIYDYAQRYGYQPKAAAPQVNPIEEASKRIEELTKTQAANKSLSDTGGRGAAAMSAEEILAMPDKELTRWLNKSPKNREFFDKLLGA